MLKDEDRIMQREIGSNFWFENISNHRGDIDTKIFNTEYSDIAYTSSGRDAIRLVLHDIKVSSRKALLPEFTCNSVIQPFVDLGYEIVFYPIHSDLSINEEKFEEILYSFLPGVIYIHNYFGFDTSGNISNVFENIQRHHTVVIEDITQVLYSSFDRLEADYLVGSFRKWAGLADGGFALKKKGKFSYKPNEVAENMVSIKLDAMQLKTKYMLDGIGDKRVFLSKYSEAENLLDEQKTIYKMSDYSFKIQSGLDIDYLCKQRIENYQYLASALIECNLFKIVFDVLPDNVVPLYFPILCTTNRMQIQNTLREHDIYAPIVWPQSDLIEYPQEETHYVYTHILCIPCDQRYALDDMEEIVAILKDLEGQLND